MGVAFATVRKAYAPVAPPSKVAPNDSGGRRFDGDRVNPDFIRRGQRGGQGSLAPGCDEGYGGGMLDLCLAEQCSSLIRELYKVMIDIAFRFFFEYPSVMVVSLYYFFLSESSPFPKESRTSYLSGPCTSVLDNEMNPLGLLDNDF